MIDLITKMLECESENDFFQKEKIVFFRTFSSQISNIDSEGQLERMVENIGVVFESLLEKHEDKYERGKYASLVKSIVEDVGNFRYILQHLQKYNHNHRIKTELLNCLHLYLKIHMPAQQGSSIHEEDKSKENISINQTFIGEIKKYFNSHQIQEFVSDLRNFEIIQVGSCFLTIKLSRC